MVNKSAMTMRSPLILVDTRKDCTHKSSYGTTWVQKPNKIAPQISQDITQKSNYGANFPQFKGGSNRSPDHGL